MEQREFTVAAKISEFKGNPTITLSTGDTDRYPFTFGLAKARRILACIEDIKSFVANAPVKPAKVAVK
jgi:hypothetical protein